MGRRLRDGGSGGKRLKKGGEVGSARYQRHTRNVSVACCGHTQEKYVEKKRKYAKTDAHTYNPSTLRDGDRESASSSPTWVVQ